MSALLIAALAASAVAALLHGAFFVAEALLFDRPAVRRLFGVRSADQSRPLRLFAANVGVYNLGLALLAIAGGAVVVAGGVAVGAGMLGASLAVMLIASVGLVVSSPRMWRGALLQGIPAGLALTLLLAATLP